MADKLEVIYREIKPSKIPATYSATPEPPAKPFRPYLLPDKPKKSKNSAYAESWKL